jgi:hypothetical protein
LHVFFQALENKTARLEAGLSLVRFIQTELRKRNVFRAGALLAFSHLKLYGLSVGERGVTAGFDFGMMHEKICGSFIGCDESKTFVCVEPLYCAFTHTTVLVLVLMRSPDYVLYLDEAGAR